MSLGLELDASVLAVVKECTQLIDATVNRMRSVCSKTELNRIDVMLHRGMIDVLKERTSLNAYELRPYLLEATLNGS